jgi:hypothetical protein
MFAKQSVESGLDISGPAESSPFAKQFITLPGEKCVLKSTKAPETPLVPFLY